MLNNNETIQLFFLPRINNDKQQTTETLQMTRFSKKQQITFPKFFNCAYLRCCFYHVTDDNNNNNNKNKNNN